MRFSIKESQIDETIKLNESPKDTVKRLAYEKALDVAKNNEDALVIGADTVVVIDDKILGKPKDETEAYNMIKLLSGKTHYVITGFALINLSLNKKIGYYEEPILDLKKDNKISTVEISDNGLILYPDKIYVARSNEWTETENLVPMMSGRSSLGRLGLHVHCSAGMGSIGYKGYWHLGVRPSVPVKVYENMKVCQIYYFTTEGEIVNTYTGSMQSASPEELGSKFHTKMKKLEISHK